MSTFRVKTKLACASLARCFLLLGTIKTGVEDIEDGDRLSGIQEEQSGEDVGP